MKERSPLWGIVPVVLSVMLLPHGIFAEPYCIPETPAEDQPQLPELIMDTFTVEYRATIIDKNYTMWAKESFDATNNKLRMDTLKNGIKSTHLFDYQDNSYVSYKYHDESEDSYDCLIRELTKVSSDNFDLFGFKMIDGSRIPHVVSSQKILLFAKSTNPVYKNRTTLNGLVVDHWQSCITWDDVQATFTLDYYFTTVDFEPYGYWQTKKVHQMPVRAEVNGAMGPTGIEIHHVYEYLDFKANDKLPAGTFSLPDFMLCDVQGNVWNKPLPSLPDYMSYTLEKVSRVPDQTGQENIKVVTSSIYRDAKRRTVRLDSGRSTSISDFNTGLEYLIDDSGCLMRAIDPNNVPYAASKLDHIIMKDSPEIAYLREDYQWSGYKVFRGNTVNAFVRKSKRSDEFVEIYMNKENVTPLGLLVVNVHTEYVKTHYYNLYNFLKSPILHHTDPFDVRACQDSDTILDFDVKIDVGGCPETSILAHIDNILYVFRDTLASITDTSPIQISYYDYRLDTENNRLHWFGSLMGSGTGLKTAKVENQVELKTALDLYAEVASAIKTKKLNVIFTNENDGFSCTFSGTHIQSEAFDFSIIGDSDDVMHKFTRLRNSCAKSLRAEGLHTVAESARECAQSCLSNKLLDCSFFQFTQATKSCQYSWRASTPERVRSPGCDTYIAGYLHAFEASPENTFVKRDNTLLTTVSRVENCAELCFKERQFRCQSFDLCDGQYCRISPDDYLENHINTNVYEEFMTCSHFSRNNLDEYDLSYSTHVSFPGQAVVTTDSNTKCAKLCSADESGCAMFSSCLTDDVITCTLVPTSKADQVSFSPSKNCNVYKAKVQRTKIGDPNSAVHSAALSDGYSSGEMAGLSVAMVLTGAAVGALIIVLLRRFHVWGGF